MLDDRKASAPYVVVFTPGDPIGCVDQMAPAEASAAVGGFASQTRWGNKYLVYHARNRLEAAGAAPNRLIDSHVVYGLMIVTGWDKPLTGRQAVELAYDCPWPMAQLEAYA